MRLSTSEVAVEVGSAFAGTRLSCVALRPARVPKLKSTSLEKTYHELKALRNRSKHDLAKMWWKAEGHTVRRLCEREYWKRLWVLQELRLAKSATMTCGKHELEFDQFEDFLSLAHQVPAKCRREQSYEYQLNSPARSMVSQQHQYNIWQRLLNRLFRRCPSRRPHPR